MDKMHRSGWLEKGKFVSGKWERDVRPQEEFFRVLNLSPEQQVKIKEIMERTRSEMEKIGKDIRASINEIRQKNEKEIMGILTIEQQEKFKAMQERRRQRAKGFEERRGPDAPGRMPVSELVK
jgi:Spy/CpxP family protein refolding chaperone